MRKFLVVTIPVVTIIFFVLIMISGDFLKKPLGKDDNVPLSIDNIIEDIKEEKWDQAGKKAEQLQQAWRKIVARVQFSSERDEINYFSMSMARLNGAIIAKDKPGALMELKEAYEHWEELGK